MLYSVCKVNCALFGIKHVPSLDVEGVILIFDASNTEKFSRHVVLNLYRIVLFRDQMEVCKFVHTIQSLIMDLYTLGSESVFGIIINHMEGVVYSKKTFIDMAVYKRNQQFRLIRSKFKDEGSRPLTLMVNHEVIGSNLSNIHTIFF